MFNFVLVPLIVSSLGFVGLFLGNGDEDLLTLVMSFLIVVPVSAIAIVAERKDLFSPLNIFTYILIVSAPLFSIYVLYFADDWNSEYAVFWQDFVDVTSGIVLIVFAFACLLFGYFHVQRKTSRSRIHNDHTEYSVSKLRIIGILVLIVSVLAGFMFARDVNYVASLADNVLSKKSIHEATVGMSVRGSALTHWRLLGISLPHGFLIVFMTLVWLRKIRAEGADYALLGIIFMSSCFIPFIAVRVRRY